MCVRTFSSNALEFTVSNLSYPPKDLPGLVKPHDGIVVIVHIMGFWGRAPVHVGTLYQHLL